MAVQSFLLYSAHTSFKVGRCILMDSNQWFLVCSCCLKQISHTSAVYIRLYAMVITVKLGIVAADSGFWCAVVV